MTAPILRRRPRRGFSLPELLISMVLISIIGLALTRLVVSESRFNNRQVLQRNARGVSRGALNIMTSELRMADQSSAFQSLPSNPTDDRVQVNVPWAVGIRCGITTIAVMPIDSLSEAIGRGATWGVGLRQSDGRYQVTQSVSVSPTTSDAQCTANGLTVNWGSTNAMPAMQLYNVVGTTLSGSAGQPVMLYYRVRYRIAGSTSIPGRFALFRRVGGAGGVEEELVGPFQEGSGFRYYVGTERMPRDYSAVTDWEQVSGVQLNLVGESERQSQGSSTPERANLSTAIFFRNRL